MAYTVLARRYRSASFDQVVGQEPIAHTLQSAIRTGRVAHAYLFTGTRGVGKTSMARIFARALNAPDTIPQCPKPGDFEYPPVDVQQRMADAVMRGDDLNVIEIDGASNRGVDEARQLISNAGLAPTANARYKVYIIDEVHMLTREAFNALLKTMEEPPSHVKFILCTTEVHKVPATILSRCQRFDFRNIATQRIAQHLRQVIQQENLQADDQLIWEVARLGNGSMRDALSLLDRVISAGSEQGRLASDLLQSMLGLPPQQRVISLINSFASGDVPKALVTAAEILDSGISQDQLLDVLIERLRQLMLVLACGPQSALVELSDDAREPAARQASQFDVPGLVHMIALCESLQRSARSSSNPRALLDATLVRMTLAEHMADVTAVLRGGSLPAEFQKKKLIRPAPEPAVSGAADPRAPAAASRPASQPAPRPVTPTSAPAAAAQPPASAPAQPPARPAAAPVSFDAAWAAVQEQGRGPLAWLLKLDVVSWDERLLKVSCKPGQRDILKFLDDQNQRDKLAQLMQQQLGRPVKIEVQAPARDEQASAQPAGASATQARAQAANLPLVRQVQELFDVSILDVRAEPEASGSSPVSNPVPNSDE